MDYRHNPFEFLLRNFDQWVGAPGPEAFATPLDENPRAKHAIVRLKSPFSRFIPPFHAAGSPPLPFFRLREVKIFYSPVVESHRDPLRF